MGDPRTSPDPHGISVNEPERIILPIVDLTRGQNGPRDRQLLFGEQVTVLNRTAESCLIRAEKDGYCGTVTAKACAPRVADTHKVTARTTHAYTDPNFKSKDCASLPFGARVRAISETATFIETELGFVPRQHLHPMDTFATDPVSVADIFLGAPYLWGGNSHLGIDCSGLVQAAFLACGLPCPADSDQQAEHLGMPLAADVPLQRNDVVFWKGHVALVADEKTLLHANAGYMSVVYEPIADALARIEAQGDGVPTHRKRVRLADPKDPTAPV